MVMTDQEIRKSISGTTPFMFDLYRQYNFDKSTTMSPISIMLLMSILANGASGETKKGDYEGAWCKRTLCSRLECYLQNLDKRIAFKYQQPY